MSSKISPEAEQFNLIYSGRRKYLVPPNKNNLEPPKLFKTKQQAKKKAITEILAQRDEMNNGGGLEFKFKMDIPTVKAKTTKASNAHRHRKEDDVIVIEKYSSTARADWKKRIKAGVEIWINRNTGEVSTECPYISSSKYLKQLQKDSIHDEEIEYGTGCLVYDSSEISNLFALLDTEEAEVKQRKSQLNSATQAAAES